MILDKMIASHPRLVAVLSVSLILVFAPLFVLRQIDRWRIILSAELGAVDVFLVQLILACYLATILVFIFPPKKKNSNGNSCKAGETSAEDAEGCSLHSSTQDSRDQYITHNERDYGHSDSDNPSKHGESIAENESANQSQVISPSEGQSIKGRIL
ncbi:MAG TPA: hypothetical protein G4O18_10600 [Dehalococcoidia bacterium]|nr:hypothetical protein [Dehalococcoidia bacterium]